MNNAIKYFLLFLATSAIANYASACEVEGGSAEDCNWECAMAEDYDACVLGATQNPNSGTTPSVTMQSTQPEPH